MQNTTLVIPQASDWSDSIDFMNDDGSPVNITGYNFTSAFKTSYYTQNVAGNFVFTIVNAPAGNLTMSLSAATSQNISAQTYVYDVYMTDTFGANTRILQGLLILTPSVTY